MDARVRSTDAVLFDGLDDEAAKALYDELSALEWFAAALIEHGFRVERTVNKNCESSGCYYLYSVKGHGIIGAFSTSNAEVSRLLCGTFVLDNAEVFTGFVSCPMAIRIHTRIDLDAVLAHMFFLGSPHGYTYSASKSWKDHNTLPREMREDCEADIRRMLQV